MAELLHDYGLIETDGEVYHVRACGSPMDGETRWQGWLEFTPSGGGAVLRSQRETTQPNREDTAYWATGLTAVYLEGSLRRALKPLVRPVSPPPAAPAFDGPARPLGAPLSPSSSVLNPFSVYRKGEALLRDQLHALSGWHLVNIIRAHELSDIDAPSLNDMTPPELIEIIVAGVRHAGDESAPRARIIR